jgi:hypothetical protein
VVVPVQGAEVMGKVVQFPDPRGASMTEDEWQESLLDLHDRLCSALTKERKQIDNIRMVLSIDDVMGLCQLIEDELGPDCFSD